MQIKNITILQYFNLKETILYDSVFEYLEPINNFKGSVCNINNLTFDEMSVIKKLIGNPTILNLRFIYSILYKEWFDSGNVIEFMQSYKWILNEIKEVAEREKKLLFSEPDYKLIGAGVQDLNKFGTLNTKISIGSQFGIEPRLIGEWKYKDVLHIQAHNITTQRIQKNLSKQK